MVEEAKSSNKFSWHPGHVKTAKDALQSKWLPLLDVVIELIDARAPISSQYPDSSIWQNRPLVQIYTKADLANLKSYPNELEYFFVDARKPEKWRRKLIKTIKSKAVDLLDKLKIQGRKRNLRVGVCGLPNVGKSTFLNSFIGGRLAAKTGNKPGVTKQTQWVPCDEIDLLDTPGITPFSFNQETAMKLALCNLVPDKSFDPIDLCRLLFDHFGDELEKIKLPTSELEALKIVNSFRQGKRGRLCLDDFQR